VATRHPDRTPRKVQMSFHFHVAETDDQAIAEARGPRDQYVFDSLPQTWCRAFRRRRVPPHYRHSQVSELWQQQDAVGPRCLR
jgi:hypothetical protein